MLSNSEQKERKSRIAALAGTILFHTLMLFVLLLLAFHTPIPLPEEEGVEVYLGHSTDGGVDMQPKVPPLAPNAAPLTIQNKADSQLITKNIAEAPAIVKNKKKTVDSKPTIQVTKRISIVETPEEYTVIKKSYYSGKKETSSKVGKPETTRKQADQGKPNGTPGSPNYEGNGGIGNGVSFDLAGRGARSLPKPTYDYREQGLIVVSIKVNREGKVIYASAGAKGTTISEINLHQQAESAARKTLFAPDADAPDEQSGTITYKFIKQK